MTARYMMIKLAGGIEIVGLTNIEAQGCGDPRVW